MLSGQKNCCYEHASLLFLKLFSTVGGVWPLYGEMQLEAEYLAAAANKNPKRPIGFENLPEAAPAATNSLLDFKNKKGKKK
jgi:hypothetical protein